MAINLTAIFRVQDNGSAQLRRIARQTESVTRATNQLSESNNRAARAAGSFRDSMGRLRDANGRFIGESKKLIGSNGKLASSFDDLESSILGLAGAYAAAQAAASVFDATVGAAARYEQSAVTVEAMFNDKKLSDQYMQMVERVALDSPLLSSGEILSASPSMIAMHKDLGDLEKALSIVERLRVLNPNEGVDGGVFAMLELWSGDMTSMVERFRIPKSSLESIKDLDIPDQIEALGKLLDEMGITQEAVEKMGSTTLGFWSQINERVDVFNRNVGKVGNTKLGDLLGEILEGMDEKMMEDLAKKVGDSLGEVLEVVINIGKWLWEWREPVGYILAALGSAGVVLVLAGILSLLSMVSGTLLAVAAGVGVFVAGFAALYNNNEQFKGFIDGIVGKVKELYGVFKSEGVGGLLDAIFGEGTAEKVMSIIDTLKDKFNQLKNGFEIVKNALKVAWETITDVFNTAWSIIGPILEGLWNYLQIVIDVIIMLWENVIAPIFDLIVQTFQFAWSIIGPILRLIAGLFSTISDVALWLWENALSPLVEFIMNAFANALESMSEALEVVSGWFDGLSDAVDWVLDKLGEFSDFLSNIELPKWISEGINTTVNIVGKAIGAEGDGKYKGHYHGLSNVPYDGYAARLHKGERVLTAQENKEYSQGGFNGITISGNTFNVREEADIEKIAYKLAKYIEKEAVQVG